MRLIDADTFMEECRDRIDMQDAYLPTHIKDFVIDEMPTIEPEQVAKYLLDKKLIEEHHAISKSEWIPVSEVLPVDEGRYLVTMHEYGSVGFDYDEYKMIIIRFINGSWRLPISMPQWIEDALTKEVIAWMPLPKPYEVKHE